jgi:hypothetical protein
MCLCSYKFVSSLRETEEILMFNDILQNDSTHRVVNSEHFDRFSFVNGLQQ